MESRISLNCCPFTIWHHHHPYGMMMPNRDWSSESGYRFGFGGQEQDDEVAGNGNSYTAEFWQYDPRLGRRWNVDPVIRYSESSYASFRNSPLSIGDQNGLEGEVEIDNEEKKATVTLTFFYNGNDSETQDAVDNLIMLTTNSWSDNSKKVLDDNGDVWSVAYKFVFIRCYSDKEVTDELENNLTSNSFEALEKLGLAAGTAINRNLRIRSDITQENLEHELGHLMGLFHSAEMSMGVPIQESFYTPKLGLENPYTNSPPGSFLGNPEYNGLSDFEGPIMSYALNKDIKEYEFTLTVIDAIRIVQEMELNTATVHIKSRDSKNPDPEIIAK